MFNQGFNKPPSKKDLKEYSRVEMQGKRDQLASWLVGLRQMRREDPERAKNYIPPKESIKRFYEEVAKEYKALPFTKEEIEERFSAENLSSLSLEEYAELLKRVPPRFILHITRQGVRDRVSFHSGRGEMSDGFKKILGDKKIKSKLEQYLGEIVEKDSVRNLLEGYLRIPEDYPTKKEAMTRMVDFLTRHVGTNLAFSEVADVSAVHASMDYVAEEFYGGEPGNEMFFLYPTAHIASQYNIADQWDTPEGFNMKDSGISGQYNDLWLKAKSGNKGELPVDASIVFIPKNTKVDPTTGSKYKIEDGKPVENTDEIEKIKTLIQSPEFKALWPQVSDTFYQYQNLDWELSRERKKLLTLTVLDRDEKAKIESNISRMEESLGGVKESILKVSSMAREFGINDQRFYDILDNPAYREFSTLQYLFSLSQTDNVFSRMSEYEVSDRFASIGLSFQLVDLQSAVESYQYWENYFGTSGKKPSKIIYYEEATPNMALEAFKGSAGITDDQHRGMDLKSLFAENVMGNNKEMHLQMQEQIELISRYSQELLDEYYQSSVSS